MGGMMRNGEEWQAKLGPGVAGDEPLVIADLMYPSLGPPTLRELLVAFGLAARWDSPLAEARLEAIEDMIDSGEFT